MKLSSLKGIGPQRIKDLEKLDIFSIEDLIAYIPVKHLDMTTISRLCAISSDVPSLFKVRVVAGPVVRFPRKRLSMTSCEIEDISGRAQAIWFNQPYMAKNLKSGVDIYLFGAVQIKQNRRQLLNPSVEHEGELGLVPVYRLPNSVGINQKSMRQFIRQAIEYCASGRLEIFSPQFRSKHDLVERSFAETNIHFPQSYEALAQAKRRLCFEELLLIQLYLNEKKEENRRQTGSVLEIPQKKLDEVISALPYELTGAQKRCIEDIKNDVASGKKMNRIIQGDVGCGKTIIAVLAMMIAAENGGQAAMMAPTDILAHQHYESLKKMFDNVVLLCGTMAAGERREALEKIKSGEAKYIIGTHALIQEKVEYKNLLLVITDEQHRFGVAQRARLSAKGIEPHTLVMSATPIPRTLSLIVFGDLDISIIDEYPKGRKKVSTFVIRGSSREKDMLDYIIKEVQSGHQAYIVCPLIEDDEEISAVSAEGLYTRLCENEFKNLTVNGENQTAVALLHGKMKSDEKNEIMRRFAANEIKVLVATTVIEVGVNVANAVIMAIYDADRFGLAQLHQLRGRVGRGSDKSYCFMLTNSGNDTSCERLEVLCKTNNGFEIAEKDFEMRGPGDYIGKRQSGICQARFSYAFSNTQILKETQQVLKDEILTDAKTAKILGEYVVDKFDSELEDIVYN